MTNVALILGTRPEIIKLAPLYRALSESKSLNPVLISTGQHKELSELAYKTFNIKADTDLGLMNHSQSPQQFLAEALRTLESELISRSIKGVIVQGDTTTALAGALSAFHLTIPVAHIEAGLRTHDMRAPFPEEMNRSCISKLSSLHFCPTTRAEQNLQAEGITENVFLTGNTVVDALTQTVSALDSGLLKTDPALTPLLSAPNKIVLVTGHRRENFNQPLQNLCQALRSLAEKHQDTSFLFPVHPNPAVAEVVKSTLSGFENIKLLEPLDYPSLLSLLRKSTLVITDSGGIQEEAPSFGVPVLVTRLATERPEAIESGHARLVNVENPSELLTQANRILENPKKHSTSENPFGDGKASERICTILESKW